jgi:hypothetical protein
MFTHCTIPTWIMSSDSCRHYSWAWAVKPNFVLLEFCGLTMGWKPSHVPSHLQQSTAYQPMLCTLAAFCLIFWPFPEKEAVILCAAHMAAFYQLNIMSHQPSTIYSLHACFHLKLATVSDRILSSKHCCLAANTLLSYTILLSRSDP